MSGRTCERCRAPLIRRGGEPPSRFAARRFCGVDCALRTAVKRPRPGLRICDWDLFAETWQAASSVAEVASKFGLTTDQAARLAAKSRGRGRDLKLMDPRRRIDVSLELADRLARAATRRRRTISSLVEEALAPLLGAG
jgi:hypothetical protein